MKLNLVYFAWVRERTGVPSEEVETTAATVDDLLDELSSREDRYAVAFSDRSALRAAIDQRMVRMNASLDGAREVALFPPMTGG